MLEVTLVILERKRKYRKSIRYTFAKKGTRAIEEDAAESLTGDH